MLRASTSVFPRKTSLKVQGQPARLVVMPLDPCLRRKGCMSGNPEATRPRMND